MEHHYNLEVASILSCSVLQITTPKCVLYFDVSDDTMTKRLLGRAQTSGRVDDNEETIKQRLKTFHDVTTPVIDYYSKKNMVQRVIASIVYHSKTQTFDL